MLSRGEVEDTRLEAKDTKKNPRPRTAFPSTDPLEAKDRNARGQGPRTQAQVFSKKKRSSQNFSGDLKNKKKGLHENFSGDLQKKTPSKEFFKRPTKFQQFKKKCCSRAEEDLRPRGQGLDLRGQGLQNVSSRTSSRPRTSLRTPPLVLSLGTEFLFEVTLLF